MPTHKIFRSVIDQLTDPDQNIAIILDKFIKYSINLVNSTDDLREELIDRNMIIQMNIIDIDFSFWLEVFDEKVIYKKGVNEKATLEVEMTKDLLKK